MINMKYSILKPILLPLTLVTAFSSVFSQPKKMNVLFIAVDDLRTELGCYGVDQIKSPNIDRLAKEGTVFNRAYCQQAVCSPSRTSLLTGLRPDSTKIYDLVTHFRSTIPDVVTLPQYFKNQGYYTKGFGKIYHGVLDDPLSWSDEPGFSQTSMGNLNPDEASRNRDLVAKKIKKLSEEQFSRLEQRKKTKIPAYECKDVPDNAYGDGALTDEAIALLNEDKMKNGPFFLAVGFRKPHLPFVAPKKYWDLYDGEKIAMAKNPFLPDNVPQIALWDWWENLRSYEDMPQEGPLTQEQAKKLKHGYYACVSYTDAQIGRLLDELDRLGLRKNTIVILWGDHGWKLGEHAMWCKQTNFENDTNAPLICSVPEQKMRGSHTNALVEFVDVYPSLCEMAGLPIPSNLQGRSFAPLLDSPNLPWKEAAYSQFPREGGVMGYSMRTDRYRFTAWLDKNKHTIARELYDHQKDPEENKNIAGMPKNSLLVEKLSQQLSKAINLKQSR